MTDKSKMGNEVSELKNKPKKAAPRNGPDGESIKNQEADHTGTSSGVISFPFFWFTLTFPWLTVKECHGKIS